jgi:hypothetical protein
MGSCIFFNPKVLQKKSWFLSRLLLYLLVPHMALTSKHIVKCKLFRWKLWQVQVAAGAYLSLCHSGAICIHFNNIYMLAYTAVVIYE